MRVCWSRVPPLKESDIIQASLIILFNIDYRYELNMAHIDYRYELNKGQR